MKRTIVALATGLLIGGAALGGPLAATAQEEPTLEQRVEHLEYQFYRLCELYRLKQPGIYSAAVSLDVC